MKKQKVNFYFLICSITILFLVSCASEESLLKAIKDNPDSISAREEYAEYLSKKKEYKNAIKEYKKLHEMTSDIKYKYKIGILNIEQGKINIGYAKIQEVFEEEPDFKYPTKKVVLGIQPEKTADIPAHWTVKELETSYSLHENRLEINSIDGLKIDLTEYIDIKKATTKRREGNTIITTRLSIIIDGYTYDEYNTVEFLENQYERRAKRITDISPIYTFSGKELKKYRPDLFIKNYENEKRGSKEYAPFGFYSFTKIKNNEKYLMIILNNLVQHAHIVNNDKLYIITFKCDKDTFDRNAVVFYNTFIKFFKL